MAVQPLAEVFGYRIDDTSPEAVRHRDELLCPFNNRVLSCTKDKADDPLGVCSVYDAGRPIITCPVRFRERWQIVSDAAAFFFPGGKEAGRRYTSLSEIRLNDAEGKSAGNIDVVLVEYDQHRRITNFGVLEVQAVYISGNVRNPFEYYIEHQSEPGFVMDWSGHRGAPSPDYLSSRKRLVPQLLYKGGILNAWGKRQAVAIQRRFYDTLPAFPTLPEERASEADMVWLLYDLDPDAATGRYTLRLVERVYCGFESALREIIKPKVGPVDTFMRVLEKRLGQVGIRPDGDNPPDAPTLLDVMNP